MVQRVLVIELVQFNNVDADNKWTSITNKKAKCIEKGEENRKYFCDIYTHTHPHINAHTNSYKREFIWGLAWVFGVLHGSKRITVEIEKDNHRLQRYRFHLFKSYSWNCNFKVHHTRIPIPIPIFIRLNIALDTTPHTHTWKWKYHHTKRKNTLHDSEIADAWILMLKLRCWWTRAMHFRFISCAYWP